MTKIIIVSLNNTDAINLAKTLSSKNDDLSIAPTFITDKMYEDVALNENFIYYMNPIDINLSFKNNSLFYINTVDYISHGITIDDYYSNDIVCLTIDEFNTISPKTIGNNVLIIWLDNKQNKKITNRDLSEVKYFQEALENYTYLYFLNEENEDIADTILKYLYCNDELIRQDILNENS